MTRYLIRRLLLTIPVMLGVATLVFALIHLVPGDPAQAMLGDGAPQGGEQGTLSRIAGVFHCSPGVRSQILLPEPAATSRGCPGPAAKSRWDG